MEHVEAEKRRRRRCTNALSATVSDPKCCCAGAAANRLSAPEPPRMREYGRVAGHETWDANDLVVGFPVRVSGRYLAHWEWSRF
jgi:hypothetical protein